MNTTDSIVTVIMNILQIIECASPSLVTLEILFCLFRTWSFTRFTNDLGSTDNSNSVSSCPMTNCWGLASSWELILSRSVTKCFFVPYGLRSSFENNFLVTSRTCCIASQEVLSSRTDRSYVVVSAKNGHYPTLSGLLKRSFPWTAHGNDDRRLRINLCLYQVVPIFPLS